MVHFIEFGRMFLSYLLVFGVTCVLAAIAIAIGIKTRIAQNAKEVVTESGRNTSEDI